MALKTIMANIAKAKKQHEAELKRVKKDLPKLIAAALAEHIPDGYALQWEQYTPYFNDGEPCEFSVNSATLFRLKYLDEQGEECERETYSWGEGDNAAVEDIEYSEFDPIDEDRKQCVGLTKTAYKKLVAAWNRVRKDEDVLLATFGDHSRVVVFSDGKYDHDGDLEHD